MPSRARMNIKKKLGCITLCCSALFLSACEFPETTRLYSTGADQFRQIYTEFVGVSPEDSSRLLKDPSAAGEAVTAAEDSENGVSPLYGQYSYYLPSLSGKNKENFDALYKGIQNFETSISLPNPIKKDDPELASTDDLMALLLNECPELLQLDTSWKTQENILHSVKTVEPHYLMDKTEYDAQFNSIFPIIVQWQTDLAGLTSFEAELAIFNDIVSHCTYSTTADYCQTAYGALVAGEAKCDGRAKALVWGLRSLGITSSVITGSEHAWVIAHIGDYDYNIDPTFDDNENGDDQLEITYTHFNVPESSIASNPYPADDFFTRWGYPETTHWEANYHKLTGKWVDEGADASALFRKQLEDAFINGEGFINLRFASRADYEAAADKEGGYSCWIQSFINRKRTRCNLTTYDCADYQTLAVRITFDGK